uniref:Uncharacterized protein n=1 Tax=Arundo donax TaxID=35708 RepID=A0A0A9CIL7_ARUDO
MQADNVSLQKVICKCITHRRTTCTWTLEFTIYF